MRITKALKRAQERFTSALCDYVEREGAVKDDRYLYPYTLDTPLGPLGISVQENCICCRFVAATAARKALGDDWGRQGVSRTGKWNFHFADDETSLDPEHCICHFGYFLGEVLFYQPSEDERREIAAEVEAEHRRMAEWKRWSEIDDAIRDAFIASGLASERPIVFGRRVSAGSKQFEAREYAGKWEFDLTS